MVAVIYVVVGASGEYSDRTEWFVCYRVDEAEAQRVAEICQAQSDEFNDWAVEKGWSPAYERGRSAAGMRRRLGMLDPWWHYSYYSPREGATYSVAKVCDDPADAARKDLIKRPCGTCETCAAEALAIAGKDACFCEDAKGCWLCKPEVHERADCGPMPVPPDHRRSPGREFCQMCQETHDSPPCDIAGFPSTYDAGSGIGPHTGDE